jgi:ribose 5-phosphate isomerase B
MEMRVVIACDHVALQLKQTVTALLVSLGHTIEDKGTHTVDPVDYPDYALAVAEAVRSGAADTGILICGSGIGMGIAANKVPGIRAATVSEPYSARMAREHNNANVLCFGARVVGEGVAEAILRAWMDGTFQGGRHVPRLEKIRRIEEGRAVAGCNG